MAALRVFLGLAFVAGAPGLLTAMDLQAETIKAWNDYLRSDDVRIHARITGREPFLWMDESPDRKLRLSKEGVLVAPMVGRGTLSVPDGLIHDWIGVTFIPNATIDSLFAVLHDYDRYKDFYRPVVTDSKMLACGTADQRFSMLWQRKVLFVHAAMQGQYQTHEVTLDAHRGYSVVDSTQLQEIQNYGSPDEHLLPAGTGSGFIWRLRSTARYEERDGGVYFELEAIALTRDVPGSLRWLVNPIVNHLSINSLNTTLRQTRDAVNSHSGSGERVASCNRSHDLAIAAAGGN